MTTDIMLTPDAAMRIALSGIPPVNFPENLRAALAAGRRHTAILREVIALRRGPGKLTPNEYFLCRYRHKEERFSLASQRTLSPVEP